MSTATETLIVRERDWSFAGLALATASGIIVLLLAAAAMFLLTGHKALVVLSGSMAPSILTGDIAVSEPVSARSVNVGDVVTFEDPSRDGVLVTHRVKHVRVGKDRIAFVTKGDANAGVERWTIAVDGTVGRFKFRIPRAGYALTWLTRPGVRTCLFFGAGVFLGFAGIRRIWGIRSS